jgi:hypothetical protein
MLLGNPPFESRLTTPGAERSYERYAKANGALPDKQLGFLFPPEAMELVAEDGVPLEPFNLPSKLRNAFCDRYPAILIGYISLWPARSLLSADGVDCNLP